MVLPPQGSDRGQVSDVSVIERIMLAAEARVISSGVTGRVVAQGNDARVGGAEQLSDLERALLLARDSNADALLQVVGIGWHQTYRPFVLDDESFREVPVGSKVEPRKLVRVIESHVRFQARLINVQNGEIVMSIDLQQSTSRVRNRAFTIKATSRGMSPPEVSTDGEEEKQAALAQVISHFARKVVSRSPSNRAAGSQP